MRDFFVSVCPGEYSHITQTRCMTFLQWQTTVSIDNTVSMRMRSCHSPRWHSLRVVGSPSTAWEVIALRTIMRSSNCRMSHCKVLSATLAVAHSHATIN